MDKYKNNIIYAADCLKYYRRHCFSALWAKTYQRAEAEAIAYGKSVGKTEGDVLNDIQEVENENH